MNYAGDELYEPESLGDYLSHYGRKNMKWYEHIFGKFQEHAKYAGRKAAPKKSSTKTEEKQTKPSSKKEKKQSHKKMSNEELQKRIDRLKIEKEYLDLTRDTRTKGKRLVDKTLDVLEKSSFDIAQQTLTSLGKKYVYQFFDGKIEGILKEKKKK